MTSIDKYLGARYVPRSYTCHNFASDVLLSEKGKALESVVLEHLNAGLVNVEDRKQFKRQARPSHLDLVLFRPAVRGENHCGIFMHGKVIHLTPNGVKFQDLDVASLGFSSTRFYTCL